MQRTPERYLGFDAGPFRLAAPIAAIRQIVDVGAGSAARAGIAPLLGEPAAGPPQALLAFDGIDGAVVLSCCRLRGVIDGPPPSPLPRTVACRWPGLVAGTIEDGDALTLVLDPRVLVGLLESALPTSEEQR